MQVERSARQDETDQVNATRDAHAVETPFIRFEEIHKLKPGPTYENSTGASGPLGRLTAWVINEYEGNVTGGWVACTSR